MAYFTKSPEEWKERDEEHKRDLKNNDPNRFLKKFTWLIIIFISLLTIVFTVYGRMNKDISTSNNIEGIQVSLTSEDEYNFPNNLKEIKIKMVNTLNMKNSIEITNFTFMIVSKETKKVVYSFTYSKKVSYEFKGISSKILFDLTKEKEISKLPHGEYEIKSNFNVEDKQFLLSKSFKYNQGVVLNIYPKEEFFTSNEMPEFQFEIMNRTSEAINKNFSMEITVYNEKKDVEYTKVFNTGNIVMESTGNKKIMYKLDKKFSPRKYRLNIKTSDLKDSSYDTIFVVAPGIDTENSGIAVSGITIPYLFRGDMLQFDGYIQNENKFNKYLVVSSVKLNVYHNGKKYFEFVDEKTFRSFIGNFQTRHIFNFERYKKLYLKEIGTYEVRFEVVINGKPLIKVYNINVR